MYDILTPDDAMTRYEDQVPDIVDSFCVDWWQYATETERRDWLASVLVELAPVILIGADRLAVMHC